MSQANRSAWVQWNVRLPPEVSEPLRAHLASPLLLGLPKGAVADFFTLAIRRELAARGIQCSTSSFSPSSRPLPPGTTSVDFF